MTAAIKTVGVAGSGTMGAGIAIVAARAGFRTIVYDTRQDALDRARKQTAGFFAKSVERKKLSQSQVDTIMGGLTIATLLTIFFVPALYAAWFRVARESVPKTHGVAAAPALAT